MPRTERPEPQLQTPPEDYNEVEKIKTVGVTAGGPLGDLVEQVRDLSHADFAEEAEQLAKSHGIYLEYDRAKTGKEKDYMYMVRISVAGGGPFTRETWRVIDEISEKYTVGPSGKSSIRLTTRQNIQFHWIKKPDLAQVVRDIARTGFLSLNGCGDNTRNVMGCPLSGHSTLFNATATAQKYGKYFELPSEAHIKIFEVDTSLLRFDGSAIREPRAQRFEYGPQMLNRKFKIAFSAVHRDERAAGGYRYDNCVELRTNDMGVAPILEHGKVVAFQVYIGGGQGERNGKTSAAMLGQPVGIFTPDNLQHGLDAVVKVHQEYGDRKNRHWARIKYVVHSEGIPWYQDRLRERGAVFEQPNLAFDVGARELHHGWTTQEDNGKLAYGMFVECGRLIDRDAESAEADARVGAGSSAGNVERTRSLVKHLMERFDTKLMITPNQDLLFTDLDPAAKQDFEAQFAAFRYGQRNGKGYSKLRLLSGACVGLPTCRLSYSDSEQFLPELIDELEAMGYGDLSESIGITGCERQCFRPATKTIGWVGQGPDMYMLKLGGSEDARHQGIPIVDGDKLYLRQVPRSLVPQVCAVLIDHWRANRQDGEDLGAFHRRMGTSYILNVLRNDPRSEPATKKSAPAAYVADETWALSKDTVPPRTSAAAQPAVVEAR